MPNICKCCCKLHNTQMQNIDSEMKQIFKDLINKFKLDDGFICSNCDFMLKSFHEFKGSVVRSHDKLTMAQGSFVTKTVSSAITRRKLGISTTTPIINLPASISIRRLRTQPKTEPKIELVDEIKFEEFPVEIIQLSDDDSDKSNDRLDNAFQLRESTDEEPRPIKNTAVLPAKAAALRQLQRLKPKWANFELTEVTSFSTRNRAPLPKITPKTTKIKVTCDYCNFQTDKAYLPQHFQLVHFNNKEETKRKLISCDKCPLRFRSRDKFIFHQNYKHPDRNEFTCPNCYSMFSSIDLLKEHQRNFRCYKRLKKRSSVKKQQNQILCPICGKLMDNGRLKSHIAREHDKIKPYICAICGKAYETSTLLKNHTLQHHSGGVKNFACDSCDFRCSTKAHLRRHIVNRHLPKKFRNRCKICLKGFIITTKFNNHMRYAHPPDEVFDGFKVDLESNNFHCPHCDRSFYRKLSLLMHINKHHKTTNAKPIRKKKLKLETFNFNPNCFK